MGTNLTSSDKFLSGILSSSSSTDDNDRSSFTTSEGESSKERLLKSRCKSEKKRRDKLNLFINDLQSMLSPGSNKRLDKLTVLKYAVNYLKMHNDFTVNISGEGKLSKSFFLPCDELGQLMLEVLNGFIMMINEDAKFVYIADVVEKVLGVKAASLTEKTVHSLVHEEDRDRLTEEIMSGILNEDPGLMGSSSYMDILSDCNKNRTVSINFRILVDKKDCEPEYQPLHCTGKWYSFKEFGGNSYGNKVLVLLACLKTDGIRVICAGNDGVSSFSSKHSLDGSFLYADTNCPSLTGYLPYELLGKSIYSFIHPDDLSELCAVHEQVTSSPSTEPAPLFIRFLSKGEEWLIFEAQFQLVLKQISMHPNYISIKFTLATEAATRDFRKFADEKVKETERLLYGIQGENNLPSAASSQKEIQSIGEEVAQIADSAMPPLKESINMIIDKSTENEDSDSSSKNDVEFDNAQLYEFTKHLHTQLEAKHEFISKSFQKQKKQIENIGAVMKEYAFMMEAPSFKVHYKQQVDMFEYFKYVLKKQQRQQEYLFKQLKSKRKQLEIHQRAMKLRNMAVQKQKYFNERKIKGSQKDQQLTDPQPNATNLLFTSGMNKRSTVNTMNNMNSSESIIFTTNCRPVNRNNGVLQCDLSTLNNTYSVSPSLVASSLVTSQTDNILSPRLSTMNNFQSHQSQQRNEQSKNELPFNQNAAASTSQLQELLQSTLLQQQLQLSTQQNISIPSLFTSDQNSNNNSLLNMGLNINQVDNQSNESGNAELQSAISNQILVHLQILQRHILSQLQTAVEVREKTGADFSQILPVLQQLQQLQQYIIEQQTKPLPTQPEAVPSNSTSSRFLESLTSQSGFSGTSRAITGMEALLVQSLGNIDCHLSSTSTSTQQCQGANSTEVAYTSSGSAFGDLMASQRELEKIKKVFSYDEQKLENEVPVDGDCFQNLPSPDLKNLICSDQNQAVNDNNNNANNDNNDNDEDDLKKSKKLETENASTFQPLLISQQQLEQLQQYQRMQIHNQQEQTLNMIQSQIEESLTQANPPLPMIDMGEMVSHAPSSTTSNAVSTSGQITSTSSAPGLNGQEYTYSLSDFTDQNINDNSNWITPENEEVMNMLLTDENDFF